MPSLSFTQGLDVAWLCALALLAVSAGRREESGGPTVPRDIHLAASFSLAVIGVLTLGVWWIGGRGATELGFRAPDLSPLAWGILVITVGVVAAHTVWKTTGSRLEETRARWRSETSVMPERVADLPTYLLMAGCAGLFEEIAFRGFAISVLLGLAGDGTAAYVAAVGAPALFFGFAHRGQGVGGAVAASMWAAGLGAVYVMTGSLWPPILAHILWDANAGVWRWALTEPTGR
ncbi:MAG: CPBP family intramembrane glutamic endopeptidase [Gemmatimonadota bacterium]